MLLLSVGCELFNGPPEYYYWYHNGRAFEIINKIKARVQLAARCPVLYSIAAQRCRYGARPYNVAEAKRQCDVPVRVQHAASPMLGVNNKENRLLLRSVCGQDNPRMKVKTYRIWCIWPCLSWRQTPMKGQGDRDGAILLTSSGPPQNLGILAWFSREQLGRFKHPATRKNKRKYIVFYCARQDRRIGVVCRGYYAYDDYIESSLTPNQ